MDPRTASQLEQMTRERLHDLGTTRPRWSSEAILRALSEAEREACLRARLLRDSVTEKLVRYSVAAGRSTVLLHPSIYSVEAVRRDSDGVNLTEVDEQTMRMLDPRWRDHTATQMEHFIVQLLPSERIQLRVFPIPSVDDALVLDVFRMPRFELEDPDDEPEIAPRHHDHLVDWAVYRCFSNRDVDGYDPVKAEAALASFTANFGEREDANVQRKHRERTRSTVRALDY